MRERLKKSLKTGAMILASVLLAACSNSGNTPQTACPAKTISQENLVNHEVKTDINEQEISDDPQYDVLEAVLKQSGMIMSDSTLGNIKTLTTANIVSSLIAQGYPVSSASSWEGFVSALEENMINVQNVYPIMVKMPNKVFPPTMGESGENWMGVFGCKTTPKGEIVSLLVCSPTQTDSQEHLKLTEISFSQLECLVDYYGAEEKIEAIF